MIDLLNLTNAQLRETLVSWGQPAYRADQIDRWVYHDLVTNFDAMTNLPRDLRERLQVDTKIGVPPVITETKSVDGMTRKALLKLDDGQTIETVLMLYADAPNSPGFDEATDIKRRTICISTQVGCPIGCPFCATGQAGYIRNLTAGEIVAQVLHYARTHAPITNIVIMGMGEPFMKFDVTWQAIESLTSPTRFGLGARRITVSTSGEVPGIEQLTYANLQINLAVSLHAPDDELRNTLVPLNRKFPIKQLMRAIRTYIEKTNRRVTFEYALMNGVNDKPEQAQALAHMLRGLLCHVNLIPLNPTKASPYQRSTRESVLKFETILREAGIQTTVRVEKGIEIAAGCGQLRQVTNQKAKATNQ